MFIKVYHSFGSQNQVQITGHVFEEIPPEISSKKNFFIANLTSLLSLFKIKTLANVDLELNFSGKKYKTKTMEDGFFRFEFKPETELKKGWHNVEISGISPIIERQILAEGKLFVPQINDFAIISDIDDTVMKSYSSTIFRRLYELVTNNAYNRKIFEKTVEWYRELAEAFPPGSESRAFFYVSSSEWNLYEYLNIVFKKNELPEGIFLLNSIKKMNSFFKSGKTVHDGKLLRIGRLMNTFPEEKFILIGDNTQRDPMIYEEIVTKYPNQVKAVFIRNRKESNRVQTDEILKRISQKTSVLQFTATQEAIDFSLKSGLIRIEEIIS
jgi:phosphatidate phosphatase APP1